MLIHGDFARNSSNIYYPKASNFNPHVNYIEIDDDEENDENETEEEFHVTRSSQIICSDDNNLSHDEIVHTYKNEHISSGDEQNSIRYSKISDKRDDNIYDSNNISKVNKYNKWDEREVSFLHNFSKF